MHSSLPQQLINFKFTNSKLLIGLFKKLEKKSLETSDAIITICPELEKFVLPLISNKKNHHMIENSLFETIQMKSHQIPPHSVAIPEGRKIVVYAGTFEKYQGIDLLIASFQIVAKELENAFLLMIGGTEKQVEAYRKMVSHHQISKHCALYTRMPQPQVREIVGLSALQVSPRIGGTNSPLKTYEQLANGIPLIATRILSHTQILNEGVCFLVESNPQALAEGMLAALHGPKKCLEKVENAKNLYDKKYSREMYEKKIESLLEQLYTHRE